MQSKKTIAEPRNSTYLLVAQSTPKACFFMRNIRTPQNKLRILFQHLSTIYSSMVACSGKGSPFAVVHKSQFSRPLHVTAKASKLYAVTLKKLSCGVTQMYQFIFAAIRRTDLTNHIQKIRITADTEQAARAKFARDFVLVLADKINLQNASALSANTFPSISFAEVVHA